MNKRIVAIVPMRHSSERVKGKNYRPLAGKPLFHHIVSSLLAVPHITKVLIDTDSPTIMEDAAKSFPDVQLYLRPEHLRDGGIPMNDILLNDTNQLEADFYLQTHSTNPLLPSGTINAAIEKFLVEYPIYDSLFTVTKIQSRLWDALARAVNHNPAILLRTQDLPPVYEENSNLYIFTRDILQRKHNRIGDRPLMFEVDRIEAWDIDEEIQFRIAESLLQHRTKSK